MTTAIATLGFYVASVRFNMFLAARLCQATTPDFALGPLFIPIALRRRRRKLMQRRNEILRDLLIRMENNEFHERYGRGLCSELQSMKIPNEDRDDVTKFMERRVDRYKFESRTPNSLYWFRRDHDGMQDRIAFLRILITKTDGRKTN